MDGWTAETTSSGGGRPSEASLAGPIALILLVAGVPGLVAGQASDGYVQEAKLVPPNASEGDLVGQGVAVEGKLAAVSAATMDTGGGSVHVYERVASAGWVQQAELSVHDSALPDFGHDLVIDEGRILVENHLFARGDDGTWRQVAELEPEDYRGDNYPTDIAFDGERAVLSAYDAEASDGATSGAAYVFEKGDDGSWVQEDKLSLDGLDHMDAFGASVALQGQILIVGSLTVEGYLSGRAHVFTLEPGGSWTEEQVLAASDGEEGDMFATSSAIDGRRAVFGAYDDDNENGGFAGSAYVFVRDDGRWTERAKLTADDGGRHDAFGYDVSLDGRTVLASAPQNNYENDGSGKAYVFAENEGGGWTQEATLTPRDGGQDDAFGIAATHDDGRALIGAPAAEDATGAETGAAYAFVDLATAGPSSGAEPVCEGLGDGTSVC